LTIQFILLAAGILLIALCYVYFKFRQMTEQEFYDGLRSKALMTAEMVLQGEEEIKPLPPTLTRQETGNLNPARQNVVIYNTFFQKIFAFNNADEPHSEKILAVVESGKEQYFQHGERYAIGLKHVSRSGKEYIVVAESPFSSEPLKSLRNILIFTFLFGVGLVAAGGWFYAGQAMSPVSRIVNQVDNILPSDLSARLESSDNQDEISRLVHTFNRMLGRIQVAFQMQKNFISNVSHELRNPLSVILSQIDVALDKHRSAAEYQATLQSVQEDTRELSQVAEKLLQLARISSEQDSIALGAVRLDEVLFQARNNLLKSHADYHVQLDFETMPDSEEDFFVRGNEHLLRAALQNLMENGCKFSPDKKVAVRVRFDPSGRHQVRIADNGPGIPQAELPHIFQPFYRSQQSRQVRGFGIGLSLVDTIAKIHQINLDVRSDPGKGTMFILDFKQNGQ
jgi:signal transduction histidine kinase